MQSCSAPCDTRVPETKRRYQLGMAEQVRKAVEKANTRLYGRRKMLHLRDSRAQTEKESFDRRLY